MMAPRFLGRLLLLFSGATASCWGVPTITNVSVRGLRIGEVNTIIVEGTDLLPNPSLVAGFAIAQQNLKPNGTAQRVELEVRIPDDAPVGIHSFRVASGKGISGPVLLGLDRLAQTPFTPEVSTLPVALHGSISGTQTLRTKFHGVKGQRIVADVEARRLGAGWQPVVRILNADGRQLAWSPARPAIAGDARAELMLPADGDYQVELHDLLFRAGAPGFFRLKLGELSYADLAFPLGVQIGQKATLQFRLSNVAPDVTVETTGPASPAPRFVAAPVPPTTIWTGARPSITVSAHPEVAETPVTPPARQVLPAVPVAVSGRLLSPKEEDQFLVPVKPGSKVKVTVFAQRLGSPLDGLLMVRNEAGGQIAANDDRPGDPDPGLEFQVPENSSQVVVALKDLLGRGGADFVYRIELTDLAAPQVDVVAETSQLNLPADSTQAWLLRLQRQNHAGPVRLAVDGLPNGVSVAGNEVPADASLALLTLTAPAASPAAGLVRIIATVPTDPPAIRLASVPESAETRRFPVFGEDFGFAVAETSPVKISWSGANDSPWFQGDIASLGLTLSRAAGVSGSIRLRVLSTQPMPRKTIKENNQDKEVDDLDRVLRLSGDGMVAADATQATAMLQIPGDLPLQDWSVVVLADLMGSDGKSVIASASTTPLVRKPVAPFTVEIASHPGIEVRAGEGATGKLTGKVRRQPGFSKAVTLSLAGLPKEKEFESPRLTVAENQEDFEFSIRFATGAKVGELKDVQVVGELSNHRSPAVPAGLLKVVAP